MNTELAVVFIITMMFITVIICMVSDLQFEIKQLRKELNEWTPKE